MKLISYNLLLYLSIEFVVPYVYVRVLVAGCCDLFCLWMCIFYAKYFYCRLSNFYYI